MKPRPSLFSSRSLSYPLPPPAKGISSGHLAISAQSLKLRSPPAASIEGPVRRVSPGFPSLGAFVDLQIVHRESQVGFGSASPSRCFGSRWCLRKARREAGLSCSVTLEKKRAPFLGNFPFLVGQPPTKRDKQLAPLNN